MSFLTGTRLFSSPVLHYYLHPYLHPRLHPNLHPVLHPAWFHNDH